VPGKSWIHSCAEGQKMVGKLVKFVQSDEKTLKTTGIPLAFCALLLYNKSNLL
jgi:hypothetical protein